MKRGDYFISNTFNKKSRLRDVEKGKACLNKQDVSIEVPIEDQPRCLTLQHQKAPTSMGKCSEKPFPADVCFVHKTLRAEFRLFSDSLRKKF